MTFPTLWWTKPCPGTALSIQCLNFIHEVLDGLVRYSSMCHIVADDAHKSNLGCYDYNYDIKPSFKQYDFLEKLLRESLTTGAFDVKMNVHAYGKKLL